VIRLRFCERCNRSIAEREAAFDSEQGAVCADCWTPGPAEPRTRRASSKVLDRWLGRATGIGILLVFGIGMHAVVQRFLTDRLEVSRGQDATELPEARDPRPAKTVRAAPAAALPKEEPTAQCVVEASHDEAPAPTGPPVDDAPLAADEGAAAMETTAGVDAAPAISAPPALPAPAEPTLPDALVQLLAEYEAANQDRTALLQVERKLEAYGKNRKHAGRLVALLFAGRALAHAGELEPQRKPRDRVDKLRKATVVLRAVLDSQDEQTIDGDSCRRHAARLCLELHRECIRFFESRRGTEPGYSDSDFENDAAYHRRGLADCEKLLQS
jgi:hypothetical protein